MVDNLSLGECCSDESYTLAIVQAVASKSNHLMGPYFASVVGFVAEFVVAASVAAQTWLVD